MEIAHTQYYGWALQNRAALLPTRAQLEKAVEVVAAAEKRLAGRIRIDSVVPDYYARYPKACMGGWGRRLMLINPAGKVLPCHAAEVIPGLDIRECARANAGVDLAGVFFVPAFSRRRLDAGTLPQLRPARRRFRRMPLPGFAAHRRRQRHGSGVLARSRAPHRRSRVGGSKFKRRSFAAGRGNLIRAIAAARWRSVELPNES